MGDVGALVKEELCEKVSRKSNTVMTVVLALEEEVLRFIYVCMVCKVAGLLQRKSIIMMILGVSGICRAGWASIGYQAMLGNGLRVMRVGMEDMEEMEGWAWRKWNWGEKCGRGCC